MFSKLLRALRLAPVALFLSGCDLVVMHPSGDVAMQERDLIVSSTVLLLVICVPVILLTLGVAWHYRQSNAKAVYKPEWNHSTQLEVVIWAAPLVIIIALGALTWVGTHLIDPYRPIARIDDHRPVTSEMKPLRVDVVALDWKWLFIYPDQGIAMVNEMAAPVDVPIDFRITSSTMMNSFSIPALAGQIYAMPGMVTQLHAVINKPGSYEGMSANYSGTGFSDMHFKFHGMSQADFDKWIATAKSGGDVLDRQKYLALEHPSQKEPIHRFATVAPGLYDLIVNQCADPGKMCMSDMMHADAQGGLGLAGTYNVVTTDALPTGEPAASGGGKRYVAAICTAGDPVGEMQHR